MTQNITTDNDEIDLAELFHALWAHKISIGFCTAFAIFCAGYYALTTDKEYTAKAVFEIQQGDNGRGFNLPGDLGALASLAGVRGGGASETDALLERVKSKEYILETNDALNFDADPYFNDYAPNQTDPLWKATIKNLIGWQSDERTADAIIENKIVETFKEVVSVSTTDAGAISLSVTHENPERAAFYANELMEFTRDLVLDEQEESTNLRLNYLSETLADALQEMERTQERLKLYALENSTVADQNFVAGSLQLDRLRSEQQDALEFTTTLTRLKEIVKLGVPDQNTYLILRDTNPMIDDVRFRRIMGMSETISAWSWPELETIQAVSATLADRVQRLNIEIAEIEVDARQYASSAEEFAQLTREAKIAEATYTVLIEQVKSQSLAAGFKPDAFKVYEYATPPLTPSAPKLSLILALGAVLGVFVGSALALMNSMRRGVYYSRGSIITDVCAKLVLPVSALRRLSKLPLTVIADRLNTRNILTLDELLMLTANQQLIFVANLNTRTDPAGIARAIAVRASTTGRKVALCDFSGSSAEQKSGDEEMNVLDMPFMATNANVHLMTSIPALSGPNFYLSSTLTKRMNALFENYDQVILCGGDADPSAALMGIKEYDPCVVLLARSKHTKKSDVQKIRTIQPIEVLLYE